MRGGEVSHAPSLRDPGERNATVNDTHQVEHRLHVGARSADAQPLTTSEAETVMGELLQQARGATVGGLTALHPVDAAATHWAADVVVADAPGGVVDGYLGLGGESAVLQRATTVAGRDVVAAADAPRDGSVLDRAFAAWNTLR